MSDQPESCQYIKLSDSEWHELFDNLEIAEQFIPGAERREHDRFPFEKAVEGVVELAEGNTYRTYKVRLRNVSASGLGIIHHLEEEEGTDASITIPLAEGGALRVTGALARCDLVTPGVYDVGLNFDCLIDPFDVLAVMRVAA